MKCFIHQCQFFFLLQPSSENMDQLHGIAACQSDDVRERNWLSKCIAQDKPFFCKVAQYSKTCVKWPLSKRPNNGFQEGLSLKAGQKVFQNAARGTFCKYFLPSSFSFLFCSILLLLFQKHHLLRCKSSIKLRIYVQHLVLNSSKNFNKTSIKLYTFWVEVSSHYFR